MSSEIAIQQPQPQQALTLQDQMNFAQAVAASDIIPPVYRKKPANVLVAVGYGAPLGLSPMQSLQDISVINGKPTASASFIASRVRMAGHKLRITKDEQAMSVTATIVRADDPDYPISVTRDRQWAQQMGLIGKDNYKKQPLTMLTWRAITAAAREACPEILYGVQYTPDEMHDLDHDNGNVTATVVDGAKPEQPSRSSERLCSGVQADRINQVLRECGVDSQQMAERVFFRHVGRHGITSAAQLTADDAGMLLDSIDFLKQHTVQAIDEFKREQQAQAGTDPQTDVKDGE